MYDTTLTLSLPKDRSKMPIPTGYKVLVALPKLEEKTKGGIIRPDVLKDREEHATLIGYVVALGDGAYIDKSKTPGSPWCKPGDWIVLPTYSGTIVWVEDIQYRLINEDSVQAVVPYPAAVRRRTT